MNLWPDGSASSDISNKMPIIKIYCSSLSDDALVSLGLEKQDLNVCYVGNVVDNSDWLNDQSIVNKNVGEFKVGNCHDLQENVKFECCIS